MFRHDCPLAVKSASTPWHLVHKKTWRDSLNFDMLLSAVSVLVVAQLSSEFPEGLMNYPVQANTFFIRFCVNILCIYSFQLYVSAF
jgi:hypothetical protein